MPRTDLPAQLIAVAASEYLVPLGCQRVGRSRTWISDQRYWLAVIEFQPSSYEKGTYLNVGAMWLWRTRKGFAFNAGYRIADFVPFVTPERFSVRAEGLATQAAEEIRRLREKFKSLAYICRYLIEHTSEESWHIFHAAIAAGLLGEIETARRLFQKFAEVPFRETKWRIELREQHALLAEQLGQPTIFRSSVLAIIQQCRTLNGLPPDFGCLEVC